MKHRLMFVLYCQICRSPRVFSDVVTGRVDLDKFPLLGAAKKAGWRFVANKPDSAQVYLEFCPHCSEEASYFLDPKSIGGEISASDQAIESLMLAGWRKCQQVVFWPVTFASLDTKPLRLIQGYAHRTGHLTHRVTVTVADENDDADMCVYNGDAENPNILVEINREVRRNFPVEEVPNFTADDLEPCGFNVYLVVHSFVFTDEGKRRIRQLDADTA